MRIIQMPDSLANKIAAGEVVERPASVVKELVENSIDAESTWIRIEIIEAGLKKIRLVDNGVGMSESDADRAFLRHATSKIKHEADLFHIRSLGFRGEALASIAAVSRLMIKTSEGEEAGTLLTMEGGKVIGKTKSDARKGTEIVVEDLFFNTPARLKYMKSLHTELGHITELLNRFALSHPHIRFDAFHNGKSLFKTTGSGQLLQVIQNIYGMGVAQKMLPITANTRDFKLDGYIGKPELTRASRQYITLIINGRFVKSYPLSQAISRGYHTMLPIGRHPIVVLAIHMDPILVDVNVHPAKMQVRFSKEKELEALVEDAIKQTLHQTDLIPTVQKEKREQPRTTQPSMVLEEPTTHMRDRNHAQNNYVSERNRRVFNHFTDEPKPESDMQRSENDVLASESHLSNQPEPSNVPMEAEIEQNREKIPVMYPIGQLHGTYILAQNDNGFYMVDQHAAQERIKYEHFKKELGTPSNELQDMLIPLTFDFSGQEALFIENNRQELEAIGLYFESFGPQSYVIRSHPNWFPKGIEEDIIRDMVEQIIQKGSINLENVREEAAIMMSCKRSIKANHHLNQDDMTQLLNDLRMADNPYTCPHGRPVIVHFSSYEIEKMFKRVM
ncbi:DNA mismatch repair endonuclease MutL [Lentibacillus saliphilus]|uniref:DNA mismatch repair endonuclease MutL n=1 Tax=Lentibacillus saliphilus TaxID=2737028 RepID=UPI001C30984B|nr:DNA mismatch repair endonuclease MutL [Lentibacillus saliphilus]